MLYQLSYTHHVPCVGQRGPSYLLHGSAPNHLDLPDPGPLIGHDVMVTITASSPAPFARAVGAILGLAALLAALVVTASPASAHARLESSSPADGSTLTAVPPEIMLRFNEPIKDGLNQVSVKSGSTDVADGNVQVDGNAVYQPVKYSMKPGKYSISYKVVSADGHPVSGTLSFTYDPPEGDTGAGEEPGATATSSGPGSGTSSASKTSGSPSDGPSSSSSAGEGTSETSPESETSTGTSPTSESTSASPSTSADTEPEEPSSTSSTSDPAVADPDETSGDDSGVSPWWIAAGAGALVVILGGVALLARGRRDSGDEEDVTLDEWRE